MLKYIPHQIAEYAKHLDPVIVVSKRTEKYSNLQSQNVRLLK